MRYKILGLVLAVFMAACSSTTSTRFPDISRMIPPISEEPSEAGKVSQPEWTALTSGVYHEPGGKDVFYGLGRAGNKDNSLDKQTLAEDRARDELAKVLAFYMERLATEISKLEFTNSVTNVRHDRLKGSMEEGTATILMDIEIINNHINSDNGDVYSMAKLDLSKLTDKLDKSNSISVEDRSFLKEAIFQAHDSMTNGTKVKVALVEESLGLMRKIDRQISY